MFRNDNVSSEQPLPFAGLTQSNSTQDDQYGSLALAPYYDETINSTTALEFTTIPGNKLLRT